MKIEANYFYIYTILLMVFGLIIEIGIRASFWCLYKTYSGIHYLYYGPQETAEDRIMRELKQLKQDNIELRKTLGLTQPSIGESTENNINVNKV